MSRGMTSPRFCQLSNSRSFQGGRSNGLIAGALCDGLTMYIYRVSTEFILRLH